jgi:hypothetical protein
LERFFLPVKKILTESLWTTQKEEILQRITRCLMLLGSFTTFN